ncbi:Protein of unknown function [Enhydrobacter aerosaccus]|uniref:DUF4239 domain-containing protein n=1 Tax=Enhydrobacter aerosaccus TaxID=225324 RepID=A0A1T4LHE6_9HYPH|nr:DUF4239 domain-containing protein [Enhydrobacter aerosaccus]SJZ54219.1 Protein of unknown function [Enhydrobacter aerosaccus]
MAYLIAALAQHLNDFAILAIAAMVFGAGGVFLSYVAHHVWFNRWPVRGEEDKKVADTVQTSLLGFSAFVLALAVTNVLSNLSQVGEAAYLEAGDIASLDRELGALGNQATTARQALADYARDVAADEWPRLAKVQPTLSPIVSQDITRLWAETRRLQGDAQLVPEHIRDALDRYLGTIERARAERLAQATKSIPSIFWIIIILFVSAASFMNGRNNLHRFGMHLIVVHMAAIGMVIALIVIVDNPFRGVTSIDPSIIADALKAPAH